MDGNGRRGSKNRGVERTVEKRTKTHRIPGISCRGGRPLVAQVYPPWVSDNLYRRRLSLGSSWYHCRAGYKVSLRCQGSLAGGGRAWVFRKWFQEQVETSISWSAEASSHLLPRPRRVLPSIWRARHPSAAFSLVPSGEVRRRVVDKRCKKGRSERFGHFSNLSVRRGAASRRASAQGHVRYREETGASAGQAPRPCQVRRSNGVTIIRCSGRADARWPETWCPAEDAYISLCTGHCRQGSSAHQVRGHRSRSPRPQGGVQEEEEETQEGERGSRRAGESRCSSADLGEQQREPQAQTVQEQLSSQVEVEQESTATVKQPGVFAGGLLRQLQPLVTTSVEEEVGQGPRLCFQVASESSSGSTCPRRFGDRRDALEPIQQPPGETIHVLPAGNQAVAGRAEQGQQRNSAFGQGAGLASRRRSSSSSRPFIGKDDRRRNRYETGVASGEVLRTSVVGRRRDRTPSYFVSGSETLQTGRKSWRKRVLEQVRWMEPRLEHRPQAKRPRQRPKGQRNQRKRKAQRGQRHLGGLERGGQGQGRRQASETRRVSEREPAGAVLPRAGAEESTDTVIPPVVEEPELASAEGRPSRAGPGNGLAGIGPEGTTRNSHSKGADRILGLVAHLPMDGNPTERLKSLVGKLSECTDLASCGMLLAWGLEKGIFSFCKAGAGPTRPAGRPRPPRGLFPLPVVVPSFSSLKGLLRAAPDEIGLSVDCWLAVSCAAINGLYGCTEDGTNRQPGKVHKAAMSALRDKIRRLLTSEVKTEVSYEETIRDLKLKKVSYTGEEISQPFPVSVEQIKKGLPPVGHGGSIPAVDFLKGRTTFLVLNPEETLLPEEKREPIPLQAKVHIQKGQEVAVFELLRERGIIRWVPEETVYCTPRGPVLNGLFGVIKPNKYTESNLPVLRVIMNLVPTNSLFRVIQGDIGFLPNAASWIPLVVAEGSELFLSQGDMSSAFYLFRVPPCWEKFLMFNFSTSGGLINMDPNKKYRPACVVLPMGWSSSVGIMQQLTREILLTKGLPESLELKKSAPLPAWFTQVLNDSDEEHAWWQVYLDNFLAGERVSTTTSSLNVALQGAAMKAWGDAGVLTAEDKQVIDSPQVVELGIRLDGKNGLLGASPERLLKTIWASAHMLSGIRWDRKLTQVLLGRWIFILQFRRAAMGVLSRSWEVLERPWPVPTKVAQMEREVLALMCLAPLLQVDMRCDYDGCVTCSDASESGGAAALSKGLTWSGRSLVTYMANPSLRPLPQPILLISVFNGIGGLFRIYDILGLDVAGRISIDISREANRVTRSTWPSVVELHDVTTISREDVAEWANAHPRVTEVHVMAGFPCVHLSSARAYRRNLEGEGSKLFWDLLQVLQWIIEIFGTFAKVKYCIENVASMDEAARRQISEELDIVPVKLDPADCLPFSRPRFAWCSEELVAMEGLELWTEKEYVRCVVTAPSLAISSWIRPGWIWDDEDGRIKQPTFMKSIKRSQPPPVPAGYSRASAETLQRWREDSYRFPPYQYGDRFLLHHPEHGSRLLDSTERELLLGFGPGHTSTCMPASDMKRSYENYEDTRKSLCGDSYSILSFAIMGAQMCADLVPRMSPAQIIGRFGLAPGASAHPEVQVPLSRWLAYGGDGMLAGDEEVDLVRRRGLTVNHTGADVRLETGHVMGRKSPAHGSVRSWWWQWKHLFKLHWVEPSHINRLEMKMILNTLLWKARDPSKVNCRWLHLEDSMVCLYVLSKGRTSSRLLQPICNRIGAVQLGLGVSLLHAHVGSSENPTDAASRSWWRASNLGSCWRPEPSGNGDNAAQGSAYGISALPKRQRSATRLQLGGYCLS